jgi:hypothetical protein
MQSSTRTSILRFVSAFSVARYHHEANDQLQNSADPKSEALDMCFNDYNLTGIAKEQEKYKMQDADIGTFWGPSSVIGVL